jgi:hypothetical protein
MNYGQNNPSALSQYQNQEAAPGTRPETDLDSIHAQLRVARDHAAKIAQRVCSVASKLRGGLAREGSADKGPSPVPNGMIGEMRETLAQLSAAQNLTGELLEMIESAV